MDKKSFVGRNVVVRIVKPYPTARNHIYTGEVVDYDGHFVAIDGCVLHFGRPTSEDPTGGLTSSHRALRWLALQRIEYIRELPAEIDPFSPDTLKIASDGSILFPIVDSSGFIPD